MKFKTELHAHTAPVSVCADITIEETIEKYVQEGYTTLVLTDHLNVQTFDHPTIHRYTGSEDWDERVDYYMTAIARAREVAAGRIHVLQASEIAPNRLYTDYLVYGLGEDFYRAHPNIMGYKTKELCEAVHEWGGLIYQAHPFRNTMMITDPRLLDGVEVWNAHPHHDSRNDFARLWAERYGLRMISGSDMHHPWQTAGGGILTDHPITTMDELTEVLRSGEYELICEGRPGEKAK